mmetsp:Transcript_29424/g.44899  ORF Transcript_29424/g.44899 Transcript_29424/m.44899 type:complete len:206 (-) Transcript_29424:23-640(-)
MDSAMKHNNNGIHFLQKGDYCRALLEFKLAAQFMCSVHSNVEPQPQLQVSCITKEMPVHTENSFIHSKPMIMLSTNITTSSSCDYESTIILVNMALCYHLDSQGAKSMEKSRENAITLYEMSYSMGLRINSDERSHHIILSALNNLGQIYNEIGEYQKSRSYLEDLTAYVAYLGNEGRCSSLADQQELILNAIVLRNPNTSAAAA